MHRILVVEDDAIIARDISLQLSDLGYEYIGPASSGEQAIEMAGQFRPDLVLMDIQLATAMDGITAALAIRSKFKLPVVFLSAFTNNSNHERAQLVEPVGYLSKPFEEHELQAVIEAALKYR